MEIKYIGFYDNTGRRNCSPAAVCKMDYIAGSIMKDGCGVRIVSPSWYVELEAEGFEPAADDMDRHHAKDKCVDFAPDFFPKAGCRLTRYLKTIIARVWLTGYLVRNTGRGEKLIVYHALMLMLPLMIAKRIKGFHMVLEVEEVYQHVVRCNPLVRWLEYRFIKSADAYLFPSELLDLQLNEKGKESVVIYGTYRLCETVRDRNDGPCWDGKTHIVYAGTLDPQKGCLRAAQTAAYLDERYHIHIIGFGTVEDKQHLEPFIGQASCGSGCAVTYEGCLSGDAYIRFLQKCHIGLCTQSADAAFNSTSFPSKVLSYLCNGLQVVSVRMDALEKSEVSKLLVYYEGDDPKAVAAAIRQLEDSRSGRVVCDSRSAITELDRKFTEKLKALLA